MTPSSLTFADQAVGTTSAAQTITATNSGDQSLFFNNVATSGDTLDFTIGTDDCIGSTLPPGASCSISVTFSPKATGTRTAAVVYTDNAADSPHPVPVTGTGTGTNPTVAIDTQFFTCSGAVCDIGSGSNVFVNNFFTTTFEATGGTSPYTWSGQPPAGLTLRPSGLARRADHPRDLAVHRDHDRRGRGDSDRYVLAHCHRPAADDPARLPDRREVKEALSGPAFNGQAPSGTAIADETQFSGCGGFSVLSVAVKKVNLPDGTQLWATLDFKPVGTITLRHGAGTMTRYNLGRFGVSRDQIRVYSSLPDLSTFQQILIGGSFS